MMDIDKPEERSRTLDPDLPQNSRGELKIKGQATTARRARWDDHTANEDSSGDGEKDVPMENLDMRENELKERALRNKVIRTRKGSSGAVGSSG